MYKNLITINLKEVARELKRKNVQFSMNSNMISILPINIILDKKYIGIYQDYGNHTLLFKEDGNLCNLINVILKQYPNIKAKTVSCSTDIFGIQILITKNNITVMQNGKIL